MELADKVEATLKPLYENIWYYQFPRNQKATASMIEYWNGFLPEGDRLGPTAGYIMPEKSLVPLKVAIDLMGQPQKVTRHYEEEFRRIYKFAVKRMAKKYGKLKDILMDRSKFNPQHYYWLYEDMEENSLHVKLPKARMIAAFLKCTEIGKFEEGRSDLIYLATGAEELLDERAENKGKMQPNSLYQQHLTSASTIFSVSESNYSNEKNKDY